jgi:hypothetical protein
MAKQIINIGTGELTGDGETIRSAFDKVNDNFNELYAGGGGSGGGATVLTDLGITEGTDGQVLKTDGAGTYTFVNVGDLIADYGGISVSPEDFAEDISTVNISDLADVNAPSPSVGEVLKWNGTAWTAQADTVGSGGIALTDISVTSLAAAGSGTLTYNNTTGVFDYTPPDLSGYQLISNAFDGDYNSLSNKPTIPSALTDLGISDGTNGQVLKTDGAGNFTFGTITTGSTYGDSDVDSHLNQSIAGPNELLGWDGSTYAWFTPYTNNSVDSHLNQSNPTDGYVLSWTSGDYAWVANAGGIALTDLSVTTASASGTPSLAYNNTTGVFTYTPPDLSNAIVSQAQYTTTVTTDAADPTDTAHHVLGNTGSPSIHTASTAWYYGDVVSDPANPTTSVVLDIDSAILTADVVGNITSTGTSTFSGTVDFTSATSIDFTGATVSGLPNDTWATLGDKDGPAGPSKIALGTNAGNVNQGANSIAIGAQAGVTNQAATSIVINATGIVLDNAIPESFVVKPVRGLVTAQALYYDDATGEVTYGAAPSGGGGTFALAGNTGTHTFDTATETLTFLGTTGQINAGIAANNVTLELDPNINSIVSISFEGATADNFETKLQAVDPTADRTINLPDADGTVALLSDIPTDNASLTNGAGYITDYTVTQADVTAHQAALSITESQISNLQSYLTSVTFGDLTSTPTTLAGYGITDAANTGSATTFTANVLFDTGVQEKFATLTGSTGVTAMNCDNGQVFYLTGAAGDITANFTNLGLTAEYGTNVTVIINQGATPYEVTAVQIGGSGQTIEWQGGSAPTGNANGIDSFSFTILNDGGSYVVLGQMVDFR